MSAHEVDYYDVQSMIRDARSEIRGEIDAAIREAKIQLRDEFQYADDEIVKFINSRTEHLA